VHPDQVVDLGADRHGDGPRSRILNAPRGSQALEVTGVGEEREDVGERRERKISRSRKWVVTAFSAPKPEDPRSNSSRSAT